jgi:hypothetical protein
MLQHLKAVIIVQGGHSNEIPFHDDDPKAPLNVVEQNGDVDVEKWLRLADTALKDNCNVHSGEDAA